jgi:hypothetical protein
VWAVGHHPPQHLQRAVQLNTLRLTAEYLLLTCGAL